MKRALNKRHKYKKREHRNLIEHFDTHKGLFESQIYVNTQ